MRDPIEELQSFGPTNPGRPPIPAAEVRRLGDRRRRRTTALVAAGAVVAVAAVAIPTAALVDGVGRTLPLPPSSQTSTPTEAVDPTPSASDAPSPTEPASPSPDHSESAVPNEPTTAAPSLTRIPDGFPLAAGLPEPDAESTVDGPAEATAPMFDVVCAQHLPYTGATDHLLVEYSAPEDYRTRQLTAFDDPDAASASVDAYLTAFEACPAEPDDSGYVTHHQVRRLDAGDESWVILQRDTVDGGATPFGAATAVVRVGNAVLFIDRAGHAGYPSGDGRAVVDEMLASASEPIAKMCVFAGCGQIEDGEIPPHFPITADVPESGEEESVEGPGRGTAMSHPTPCGATGIEAVDALDRLGYAVDGVEFGHRRELRVFANADDATAAMTAIRASVESCPVEDTGDGWLHRWAVLEASTGYDSHTFSEVVEPAEAEPTSGLGGTIRQYTRVGRAILTIETYAEWAPEHFPTAATEAAAGSAKVLVAMCLFTEAGC